MGEGADKESAWGFAWGSCHPLPDLLRAPTPPPATWPLCWGTGTVAMAAALGKLQLGNYCEHPSCLLPAPESRGASSQDQGSSSLTAGWPHPGLAQCLPRYGVEESVQAAGADGQPGSGRGQHVAGQEAPTFASASHLWLTLGADQPARNFIFLAISTPTTHKNNQRASFVPMESFLGLFFGQWEPTVTGVGYGLLYRGPLDEAVPLGPHCGSCHLLSPRNLPWPWCLNIAQPG